MGKLSMAFCGLHKACTANALDKSGKSSGKTRGEGHCDWVDMAVNMRRVRRRQPVHWPVQMKRPGACARSLRTPCLFDYFNELLIEVKTELIPVPMPFTAAMIAIAIPAAISPYSMAVAPDSFLKNFESIAFMGSCLALLPLEPLFSPCPY